MDWTFLDRIFLGNRISDYLMALAILAAGALLVKIAALFVKRFQAFTQTTNNTIDDFLASVLEKVVLPVLYISCFYLALKTLSMPPKGGKLVDALQLAVVAFFSSRLLIMFIGYSLNTYLSKNQETPTQLRSLGAMMNVVKFLVWALASIVFLDNIGFKVSTMLAGLGIGGIAIAIAAQALLKDFFSYFSIVFDQPFKLGDYIVVGEFQGTVEYIGIKTTRVRSVNGELMIFSNSDLTDSRVRNYNRMEKRRAVFSLGVAYETPLPLLREIPQLIEGIVAQIPDTAFERAHFSSYEDSSLKFETVYFALTPDYKRYMDIQQEINLAIKAAFEQRGIVFAYPTQTLYVQKTGGA